MKEEREVREGGGKEMWRKEGRETNLDELLWIF